MRNATPLFFVILISIYFIHADEHYTLEVENNTRPSPQYYEDNALKIFCSPISFNQEGFEWYIRSIYNNPIYAKQVLPYNLKCHMEQILHYGIHSKQQVPFAHAVLQLFNNKIKACPFITATAMEELLDYLPNALSYYYQDPSYLQEITRSIKDTLYALFLHDYQSFEQDPDAFFDTVSLQIYKTIGTTEQSAQAMNKDQLQAILIRFLETTLIKIIWSPLDQQDVWTVTKKISQQLKVLHDNNLITTDHLNDLYTSLIESFCRFLEIAGSELNLTVLDAINQDIMAQDLLLFTLEEQEEEIQTKADKVRTALHMTQAKIHARLNHGLITERMF